MYTPVESRAVVYVLNCFFRYSLLEDNSLSIKKLTLKDSAMFQCLASNEAGERSAYTWLRVKCK